MNYRALIILLLTLTAVPLHSQTAGNRQPATVWTENSVFQTPAPQDSLIPGSLIFRINSIGYFKNNEYKNLLLNGYTLAGINFEPVLEYHPDAQTTIRAGGYFVKNHGEDAFDRMVPVLSLQYEVNKNIGVIFGTLNGTVNHGLIEPVMNFEKYLTNNYENGLQLLINYPFIKSDLWLNWEQFLKPGDPFQEHFTVGSNSDILLLSKGQVRILAPISAVFRHKGGEIDVSNLPASTQLNMVQGLRLALTLSNSFVKSIALTQNYLQFVEIHPCDQVTIPFGHGALSRCYVDTKIGSFEIGYWKAHNYIAPHGNPLFQSVSQKDPLFLQSNREMLLFKYQFDRNLTDYLKIAFRLEPYYQYNSGRIDHSWSICLLYDDAFLITRNIRK